MENASLKRYLEILVTTPCDHDVIVHLTAPKWPSAGLNKTFSVKLGTYKRIAFSNSLRLIGTGLSSKAVHLAADDEVVVITVNRELYTIGACLALPVDVLGTEHFAVSYSPASYKCQVAVVGTQDGTEVNITLPSAMNDPVQVGENSSYYGGETFRVTLNAFDTFQLQSSEDLTGAKIISSKPVSVFSGNVRTIVGDGISFDHIVEQLPPVDTWGTFFITTPTPNRTTGDFFKIISSQDNTSLSINLSSDNSGTTSQSETFLLVNAGDFVQVHIPSDTYKCLRSTKPIQVFQIVLSQMSQYSDEEADPTLTVIPPVHQWMSDYYFVTPFLPTQSFDNFVTVVIESAQRTGVLLNGIPVDGLGVKWTTIDETTLAATSLAPGTGVFHVQHVLPNVSFLCLLYGKTLSQGYGFPAGMRMLPVAQPCELTVNEKGDGLDNDCDGLVDEELCEDIDPEDDDNDSQLDEDCAAPRAINGGWSLWSEWSDCSATFGQSAQKRSRACNSPPPVFSGLPCSGPSEESTTGTSLDGLPSASYSSLSSLSPLSELQTDQPAVTQTTWSIPEPAASAVLLNSFEPQIFASDDTIVTQTLLSSFEAIGSVGVVVVSHDIIATSVMATAEQTPDTFDSPVKNNGAYPFQSIPALCKTCDCKFTATTKAANHGDQEKRKADIVQTLALDKRSLSSAVRKKRSVHDPRFSSAVLGVSGVLVLVCTVLFVCCLDFPLLLRDTRSTLLHVRSAWNGRRTQMAETCTL